MANLAAIPSSLLPDKDVGVQQIPVDGARSQSTASLEWDGEDDKDNPFNWSRTRKWIITWTACIGSVLATLNATAYAAVATQAAAEFEVYDTESFPASFWPITSWNLGAALIPTVLLPFCENFGMRWTYLVTYVLFVLSVIPQAVAQSFATLIVTRFFAGCLGGLLLNCVGGIITDIWFDAKQRNLPITLMVFVFDFGFTIAPVIGGAIALHLHWRWVFYVQLIIYVAFFPAVVFVFKETRGVVILRQRYVRRQSEKGSHISTDGGSVTDVPSMPPVKQLLRQVLIRPAYLYFTQPVVFFFGLWSAFAFGIIFLSTQSVGIVFTSEETYAFSDASSSLVLASMGVGMALGALACIPQDAYHSRSAERNTEVPGAPIPEARLPLSIPASLIGLAGGLFLYGWTSYPGGDLPWIVPAIGFALQGFGIMCIGHAEANFICDSYAGYACSAIAAIAFGENVLAAFLPLAANAMYNRLGFQWASTLLGCVAVMLSFAPAVLMWKGPWIRSRSHFISRAGAGVLE